MSTASGPRRSARGRAPGDVLAFVGATVIVAETAALAQAKLADYRRYASPEAALVHASASMGIDLDRYGMDEPIGAAPSEAIASNLQAMAQQGMTKRKLLDRMVLGSRQAPIVGSRRAGRRRAAGLGRARPTSTASSCRAPSRRNASRISSTWSCRSCSAAAPTRRPMRPGTLREKLFGAGPRLPERHPAAAARA